MENKDWDKINEEKRLSILKGQTMNQAFEVVKRIMSVKLGNENSEDSVLKEYRRIYHKLLKANKELLNSDEKTEK